MSSIYVNFSNRREWFRTVGRILALVGLSFVAAFTLRKQQVGSSPDPCLDPSLCQGCQSLSSCSLPQAITTRMNTKESNHG